MPVGGQLVSLPAMKLKIKDRAGHRGEKRINHRDSSGARRYLDESSSKQIGAMLLRRLFPVSHEIVREFAQALDERVPSFLRREEQYAVAHSLDEYVVAFKAEFAR